MGLIYSITAAVLAWIILWALGFKSFDAILIASGLMVLSTAVWKVLSYLPGRGTETSVPDANS